MIAISAITAVNATNRAVARRGSSPPDRPAVRVRGEVDRDSALATPQTSPIPHRHLAWAGSLSFEVAPVPLADRMRPACTRAIGPEPVAAVQILVWPIRMLSITFVDPATMPTALGVIASWNPLSATSTATRESCSETRDETTAPGCPTTRSAWR